VGEARELWTKARDLFARIGAPHMAEKVQGLIDSASGGDPSSPGGSGVPPSPRRYWRRSPRRAVRPMEPGVAAMFLFRILAMAVRGLRTNLLRSLLATLGVMIGVGAVVAAVSVLEGSQRDILKTLESFGADQIIVFNGTSQRHGRSVGINSLEPEDAEAVLSANEGLVKAVSPQFSNIGQIKYYDENAFVNIMGATEAYPGINKYNVADGRFLTREDVRGSAMLVVLGHKVREKLFGSLPAVGHAVKLNGKSFAVTGVMEARGAIGFSDVDNQVIIPLSTAMQRMFGERHLTLLVVQSTSARRLAECIRAVSHTLREEHRLKPGDEDDFQIFTQERLKQEWGRFAILMAVVLYSIAGISMIVGGIGIMNIMMVSVTERTREIGVRIAVGARRMDILWQFLFEAAIISFLGGALGVLCGWALANMLSETTQAFRIYTPPMSVVAALTMAILVGLVSGIYPALRAARLDPVQALRFE
jgi:putative ABC transport system permease protein